MPLKTQPSDGTERGIDTGTEIPNDLERKEVDELLSPGLPQKFFIDEKSNRPSHLPLDDCRKSRSGKEISSPPSKPSR